MKVSELIERGLKHDSLHDLTRALMHLGDKRWPGLYEILETRPDLERNMKIHLRAVELLTEAGASLTAALDLMRQWRPDGDFYCVSVAFKVKGGNYEPCVMLTIRGDTVQATIRRRHPKALYMQAHFYHDEPTREDNP
jgi:hypothetical protein